VVSAHKRKLFIGLKWKKLADDASKRGAAAGVDGVESLRRARLRQLRTLCGQFGPVETFTVHATCAFIVFAKQNAQRRAFDILSQHKERANFAKQALYEALAPHSYYARRAKPLKRVRTTPVAVVAAAT
jgi:hypothetical protein